MESYHRGSVRLKVKKSTQEEEIKRKFGAIHNDLSSVRNIISCVQVILLWVIRGINLAVCITMAELTPDLSVWKFGSYFGPELKFWIQPRRLLCLVTDHVLSL